jgi:cytochrome c
MKPHTRISANNFGRVIVFGCIAMSASALMPAYAQNVSDQLTKYGYPFCHAANTQVVGPSFKNSSSGVWGSNPMPPNPGVPEADLKVIVQWVLAQK